MIPPELSGKKTKVMAVNRSSQVPPVIAASWQSRREVIALLCSLELLRLSRYELSGKQELFVYYSISSAVVQLNLSNVLDFGCNYLSSNVAFRCRAWTALMADRTIVIIIIIIRHISRVILLPRVETEDPSSKSSNEVVPKSSTLIYNIRENKSAMFFQFNERAWRVFVLFSLTSPHYLYIFICLRWQSTLSVYW
jgi:hypothetical protein